MAESKHDKFQRLANKRTNQVLDKLRLLGNLANTAIYDYTDEEVRKIFYTIESQLKIARAKFKTIKRKEFKL